jgi:acyl-CoA dehydrogenase
MLRGAVQHAGLVGSCAGRLFSTDLSPAQAELQKCARDFAQSEIAPAAMEYDRTMEYPQPLFKKAWERGLVNVHIPKCFGGPGASALDECLVAEELAWGCTGVATAISLNAIAEAPVIRAGSEGIKRKYLGRMIEEPLQAAYCVTEPGAGSDVAGLKTTARKHGDDWVLNGQKMWITNGGVADWFFVLARTEGGFTGFVVDGDAKGVRRGAKEIMLGQRCSDTRAIFFEDVVVGKENVLGKPGDGFKLAMAAFDQSRPVVAINAIGLAQRALDETKTAVATELGGAMSELPQSVAFALAEMASGIEGARLLAHKAAYDYDRKRRNTHYASMAKLLASEHCQRTCTEAVNVVGRAGLLTGHVVEKLYRDCKIFTIYEGTSQIQRVVIARHIFGA